MEETRGILVGSIDRVPLPCTVGMTREGAVVDVTRLLAGIRAGAICD